ncbi:MAG: T9SS type A sorting domain-containing protein [Bacteroidetes bacterium]|nr:T9SS type A sorting domain-containing protein [Bacteroidota bacterium]
MKKWVMALFLGIASPVLAQDGDLDDKFGSGGIVVTDLKGASEWGRSVKIQPDGRILVGGYAMVEENQDFLLIRYLEDGTLDDSFGISGIATTDIAGGADYGYSVALLPDGMILLAGEVQTGESYHMAVARYHDDGTIDSTFGTDGVVIVPVGNSSAAWSVVTDENDYIWLAGQAVMLESNDMVVVRLKPSGEPDPDFDSDGIATFDLGGNDVAWSIALLSDGSFLAAGYTNLKGTDDFALIKGNSEGRIDEGFGDLGSVILESNDGTDRCRAVRLDFENHIYLGGTLFEDGKYKAAVIRLLSDGKADDTFGIKGIASYSLFGDYENGYDLELQADGKTVWAGHSRVEGTWTFSIMRLKEGGALDLDFYDSGYRSVPIGTGQSIGFSVEVQDDGNIVMAGYQSDAETQDVAVARMMGSSGPLPVELSSFTGYLSGNQVYLSWTTKSESNNYGWEVQRFHPDPEGPEETGSQETEWKTIGFVAGNGTTNVSKSYSFQSQIMVPERSRRATHQSLFRLKQLDLDGSVSYSQILSVNDVPGGFQLLGNYPNPFNPTTVISYQLSENSKVTLQVYDVMGRLVATVVDGNLEAGFHQTVFPATGLSGGVYFYTLRAGNQTQTGRMLLLK